MRKYKLIKAIDGYPYTKALIGKEYTPFKHYGELWIDLMGDGLWRDCFKVKFIRIYLRDHFEVVDDLIGKENK